jgi:hypothetical protein
VRQACQIAKAATFDAFSVAPMVVGGEDTRVQLKQLGARKWPTASEAEQFERAFTDPVNKELAARAHKQPTATTYYEFPR